ncbi:hypothetical protein [Leptodesmis sichuanensis]|uniref:hypothetical protein n=1 Tax=Leptodesmis sichuanensis TaxID=2906798 RepID=UPI001F19CB5B|nr:hypothetical protein [Leptodesmis sichuanensis]UIE36881.1 hypothetical protein KIK02_17960 [Leptodesmis sichuanensis A121]
MSSHLEMTLAMSQEIDFLVMQRVFRRFVSQPGQTVRGYQLFLRFEDGIEEVVDISHMPTPLN